MKSPLRLVSYPLTIFFKFSSRFSNPLYFLFRILIGSLFLQHGGQKLFGWFGGVPMNGLMWTAGIIEFVGGTFIIVGLFTRLVAFVAAAEMLAAIFIYHLPQGWNPFIFPPGNGAELPLLYLAAFIILMLRGNEKWSLELKLWGREWF